MFKFVIIIDTRFYTIKLYCINFLFIKFLIKNVFIIQFELTIVFKNIYFLKQNIFPQITAKYQNTKKNPISKRSTDITDG